ncbi:hypothetical protein ABPG72_020159 [Tetrahymena utriculariae]
MNSQAIDCFTNNMDISSSYNQYYRLHFEGKRFQEISLVGQKTTFIRFGKLLNWREVTPTSQIFEKEHPTIKSCFSYMQRVTQKKYTKGYQQLPFHQNTNNQIDTDDTESISSLSSQSNSFNENASTECSNLATDTSIN